MKTQTIAVSPLQVEIKPLTAIRAQFKFNADGSVDFIKGAQCNVDELATLVTEECNAAGSAIERTVNLIRLARKLPVVQVGTAEKPETQSAFDYAKEKVERDCATKSTWYGVRALIEYADIRELNNLTGSVFTVKEWAAYARKLNLIDKDGKLTVDAKLDPVIALVQKGEAKVNAIRPVIQDAKKAANEAAKKLNKPAPFPTRATTASDTASTQKPAEITTATVLSSIANARFGATKLCESGKAPEMKAALLADQAFRSLCALAGCTVPAK